LVYLTPISLFLNELVISDFLIGIGDEEKNRDSNSPKLFTILLTTITEKRKEFNNLAMHITKLKCDIDMSNLKRVR